MISERTRGEIDMADVTPDSFYWFRFMKKSKLDGTVSELHMPGYVVKINDGLLAMTGTACWALDLDDPRWLGARRQGPYPYLLFLYRHYEREGNDEKSVECLLKAYSTLTPEAHQACILRKRTYGRR